MSEEIFGLGALQQRVLHAEDKLLEIKAELRELNLSIKELNGTITNIGKPRWTAWIGGGTLLCVVTAGVWGLAITPISDRVRSLETASATFVPREMHIEKWAQIKEEAQRLQNEIDGRPTKDDINRLIIELDQRLPKRK